MTFRLPVHWDAVSRRLYHCSAVTYDNFANWLRGPSCTYFDCCTTCGLTSLYNKSKYSEVWVALGRDAFRCRLSLAYLSTEYNIGHLVSAAGKINTFHILLDYVHFARAHTCICIFSSAPVLRMFECAYIRDLAV